MKHSISILFLALLLSLLGFSAHAQDPNFHIYLCIGQSNMEGPARIEPQDTTVDSRLRLLASVDCPELGRTKGNWYTAKPPLCRCNTRLSPADYFGRTLVANLPKNVKVGFVHVAVAGSKIEIFDKKDYKMYLDTSAKERPWMINMANQYGGNPYERLVEMARLAQKAGVIKGILLHQGESNTGDKGWPMKVKKIYDDLLTDLNLPANSLPLLAGELVNADQGGKCASMNPIIATLPQVIPQAIVVSSKGLPAVPDKLHFSSEGIRIFGKRYAAALLASQGKKIDIDESSIAPPAPVKVQEGLLQGSNENGLSVYKGIPFAAPPVGALRWKAPQPAAKWEGIKQATQFSPAPYQGGNPPSGKSEDCLYLNIWSPAKTANENLPVMVWIYGGGFSFGATSEPVTNGEKLAKKGVILVSIAYRVNQMGFLAHPELSAETPQKTSGNYGLLDMIAGLQWVQKNIKVFGGNPDKVTIFGESAGGIAVSMLCASPLAKGLFHGAISQSGGSFGPHRLTTYPGENMKLLALAEKQGLEFMQKAGATSLAELRALPADKLPSGCGNPGGWPIVDGYVIPDDQHVLYQKGKFNHTPVLIGYNSDEGASFMPPKTPKDYIESTTKRYGPFAEKLIKAYPVEENSVPKTARDLARDAAFGWQTWAWANLQSQKSKDKVYYYYLDQHPEYPAGSAKFGYGSPHAQDVAFVFGNLNPADQNRTPTDEALSETIMTYWTNFAKNGNPNGGNVPQWEAFSTKKPAVMYFQQKAFMGSVPSEEAMKVLDKYFEWRRTPEGKEWAK